MDWIPQIFRRRKFYEDLSEEIRLHVEEHTEQLMHEGMSAEEAARAARRAFGNRALLEERSREVWQWPTLESIGADLWLAARQLRRSPGFVLITVATLALAIGANGLVFGVLKCAYPASAQCASGGEPLSGPARERLRVSLLSRLSRSSPTQSHLR
jgi:macrolide transport system ATP-binding/permease protein